jgi:transcriptional regulator of acetoin/glycerol metabolism
MAAASKESDTLPQPPEGGVADVAEPMLLLFGRADRIAGGRGDGAPAVVPIPTGTLTIGRARGDSGAAEADGDGGHGEGARGYLGLDDKLLSRVHLRVARVAGGCTVEDAGSLNGTVVDGRRISRGTRLTDGTLVFFGSHAAVFRRAGAAALHALGDERVEPLGPVPTLSPDLALTLAKLRRLATSSAELLLVGETGVGKEIYARAIHGASGRKGPFVAINCAAIPSELAESELFGYARGAHSTAVAAKPGLVQSAHGGTLFLDEIGDMPPLLQAKMLRFLQERAVTPLGSVTPQRVDVRVLAATTAAGQPALRSDLIGRFGAEPVTIRPLRERIEDVGPLIAHFAGGRLREMEPAAWRALCLHGWPRNVRELMKVVDQAATLSDDGHVRLDHLPEAVRAAVQSPGASSRAARTAPSRAELEQLLAQHHGNVAELSRSIGRRWNVVRRWILRHGIDTDRFRA